MPPKVRLLTVAVMRPTNARGDHSWPATEKPESA